MRHSFSDQLKHLEQQIIVMGQLVTAAIENATTSLARLDGDLARQVIAGDDEIDRLFIAIEKQAFQLLALQQPMARDLRAIGTGLKLVTDLERIADHAVDIAGVTLKLEGEGLIKPLADIPRMARMAEEMIRKALEAYINRDEDLARAMIEADHEVDHLYRYLFDELLGLMEQDPAKVRQATYLLHVATWLERVGDHATNLGEWTLFLITGEISDLNN
ncbi:MAG TPA: phosphate signaling complex protein PhoU [Symbiobacteriaceae bacterium]